MPELLATAEDLALFLDEDLDPARAELFLRLAGGEVRAATGNGFDFVEDEEIILDGKGTPVLLLPRIPVVDVSEVVELAYAGGTELELDPTSASSPGFEWSEDGILRRLDGGHFRRRFRAYRVTYSHGFEAVPDAVVGVVIRCAARAFENPDGIRQETLGRYSYTLAGEQAGIGLYAPDLRDLAPYMIGPGARPVSGTPAAAS
jgi:hypothetical protein